MRTLGEKLFLLFLFLFLFNQNSRLMKCGRAAQLLTISFVGLTGLATLLEGLMGVWTGVTSLVLGERTVGDVDLFTNEPTVVTEDASRVWLISDIWSTEVGRLGVPDSKRAELVWETIFFDAS